MQLKLTVAYDGTGFRGWARQPGERTVEACSPRRSAALRLRRPVSRRRPHRHRRPRARERRVGRSRRRPAPARAVEALNAPCPTTSPSSARRRRRHDFHARHSARSRSYRYRIWRLRARSPFEVNRSLWHPRPLDLQRLQASAAMVVGEHDFRAFTPTDTQHRSSSGSSRTRAGTIAATRSTRDHRRLVPAPHGPDARRHDARARARRVPRPPPGRAALRRRLDCPGLRPLPRRRRLRRGV